MLDSHLGSVALQSRLIYTLLTPINLLLQEPSIDACAHIVKT